MEKSLNIGFHGKFYRICPINGINSYSNEYMKSCEYKRSRSF